MMGAKIGNDVNISNAADMGICGDLLTIGDNVHIDNHARVRPITFESQTFLFVPISIGAGSCICVSQCIYKYCSRLCVVSKLC